MKTLIIIIILIIIGFIGWAIYQYLIVEPETEICTDQCGDGICQEVVCQAIGCPCAETSEKCPQDCQEDETANWLIYQNEEYGFEIRHPEKYQTRQDEYGWSYSLVLFQQVIPPEAGQSYCAQIEVWDNNDDYKTRYKTEPSFIIQDPKTQKYITINYYEQPDIPEFTEDWQKIISTFKFID